MRLILPTTRVYQLTALAAALCGAGAALAQTAAAPSAPASAPAATSAPAAATVAPTPADAAQKVEITGGRLSDTEERRRSTASKIIVGRDQIEKFGDATVGEVLRRLPGVTTPGAPGRGGPPRMRGLGNGFTQLMIDGQRVPPGFSLDSLAPDQIERIEILRAPTAETGARAIAGSINIITREGFKLRLNDVRMGLSQENGRTSGGINWTHNDSSGPLTYNLSANLFMPRRRNEGNTHTEVTDALSAALLETRDTRYVAEEKRYGLGINARLQWRLNTAGDSLLLMPMFFHTENERQTVFSQNTQVLQVGRVPADRYDSGVTDADGQVSNARLGLQWRVRAGATRLELDGNAGTWQSRNGSLRQETRNGPPLVLSTYDDQIQTRENGLKLSLKARGLAGGSESSTPGATGSGHELVAGAELETTARNENRVSVPDLSAFGDNLRASVLRMAVYAQDEWQLTPQWGTHVGLRWEGIRTQGDAADNSQTRPSNTSSVWTPLLHAVWKPDPKSRDQVRISLTRSYRNPSLGNLIARPTINRNSPSTGANTVLTPDSAGNPDLLPELATGLDLAFERYLEAGGVLSANLFHRQISNLIRGVVTLETVSWSPLPRHVRRQRNIGDASTTGIEFEAKFRLDQLFAGLPAVEMRSNLSLYNSRVASVPGPDNRLDEQAKATGNIGADYRLRGLPLTLGGNLNWVPGYRTQLDASSSVTVTSKRVWDAYALWTISPTMGLRFLGNNLAPADYTTTNLAQTLNTSTQGPENNLSRSEGPNYRNLQLRLELKL